MKPFRLICLAAIIFLLTPICLFGATKRPSKPKIASIGVTAEGKTVVVLHGETAPWVDDLLSTDMPDTYWPSRLHQEGLGWYHLTLDLKTGRVRDMAIAKSAGSKVLDESVINSLRYWRWKPGKWRELYLAIDFASFRSLRDAARNLHR